MISEVLQSLFFFFFATTYLSEVAPRSTTADDRIRATQAIVGEEVGHDYMESNYLGTFTASLIGVALEITRASKAGSGPEQRSLLC